MSIVGGFAGGVATTVLTSSMDIAQFELQSEPTVYIDSTAPDARADLERLGAAFGPSVIRLYDGSQKEERNPAERNRYLDTLEGYGVALTADGWLATTAAIDTGTIVVDEQNQSYRIEKMVRDSRVPVIYAKVAAAGWKPISLASSQDLSRLQSATLVRSARDLEPVILTAAFYPSGTAESRDQSTRKFAKVFNPSQEFPLSGIPAVTAQRELVGLTTARGIVPAKYMKDAIAGLFKSGDIRASAYEIRYTDNAHTAALPGGTRETLGATIIQTKPALPLLAAEAAVGNLQAGDTVLTVENEIIDANRSLSEALAQYRPGETISMTIRRKGADFSVKMRILE